MVGFPIEQGLRQLQAPGSGRSSERATIFGKLLTGEISDHHPFITEDPFCVVEERVGVMPLQFREITNHPDAELGLSDVGLCPIQKPLPGGIKYLIG
jgi:hypothetical protein